MVFSLKFRRTLGCSLATDLNAQGQKRQQPSLRSASYKLHHKPTSAVHHRTAELAFIPTADLAADGAPEDLTQQIAFLLCNVNNDSFPDIKSPENEIVVFLNKARQPKLALQMEDLLQQECLIETQIETYKNQLSLVEQQLEAAGDSDLQQLKSDLSQLIGLTEESLLEVKKQRLLLTIQGSSDVATKGACGSASVAAVGDDFTAEDDVEVTRCRAPLKEAWGSLNHHNAVIVGRDGTTATDDQEGDFKVRVLFTHPIHDAMKPCPFFLSGKCKFSDQTCKFSHGHTVMFSELQPFQDPDFSLVHIGGRCLAKYSDELWHPAIISSVGEIITVHFTTLNATAQVEPDDILPLESSDDSSSSDSGGEEEEEVVRVLEWKPSGPQQALGEWEKYTTGIGSKLLAKMGYVVGKGLGKDGQGQVEPVEIVILPSGKSLDVCAEMREAKKLRKPLEEDRKRKKRKLGKGLPHQQQGEESNIFDFLNKKIFKKDHRASGDQLFSLQKSTQSNSSIKENENLNIKLFKVQEEIKSLKKRIQSLKVSLSRHNGRNKAMVAHTREKLDVEERRLVHLQREEQTIQKNITSKTERRKLSVF